MKKIRTTLITAILMLAMTYVSANAAGTQSSSFSVTTDVQYVCSISATGISFPVYPIGGDSPVPGTGSVTVDCGNGTEYWVYIGEGLNHSGTTRRMKSNYVSTEFLEYEIYTDSGHNFVWGPDQSGGVDTYKTATESDGTPDVYTTYGLIPVGQAPSATSYYMDNLQVTVAW